MAIRKYTSGAWVPTIYRKYGTETDTITSLPAQIIGDGQPITSCQIFGNTVQNGTLAPSDPVPVQGCGEWDATAQQYKLPITCGGVTSNIYLGTQQTTRMIKKLVLKGEETWYSSSYYTGAVYAYNSQFPGISPNNAVFCSHLLYATEDYRKGTCNTDYNSVGLWMFDTVTSPSAFKSYLAAQYAAGTPVTVWYVLDNPETGIVNEPLMKIGDYADTVSVTSIPTTGTPEQFDIQTTLKPSEVQLTYHGWHEHTDTKYTQGE